MTQHLTLVPPTDPPHGEAADVPVEGDSSWVHRSWHPAHGRPPQNLLADERGAVTAEYAIIIMAAVAFAGLLVAIMSSSEVRAMLVGLVESALSSAG